MGSGKYTLAEFKELEVPNIILYAVPVMLLLVLVEFLIGQYRKQELYEKRDMLGSVGIGIGYLVSTIASKSLMFLAIWVVYYYAAPWVMPSTWWSYVLCYIVLDFCRYWGHRLGHEQRFWWATHVPHHSSEQYNFSVTFRLSWVQQVKIIFFLLVPLLGWDPLTFLICHQVGVLYQFWVHTELIGKVHPAIEYILVTPSHHRVHHGKNPQYIDKNYGSTFIIWDRMFGTFEPEVEKVRYGITTPPNSNNPFVLVFHEFVDLWKDIRTVKGGWNKFMMLWSRPGSFDREAYIAAQAKAPVKEKRPSKPKAA